MLGNWRERALAALAAIVLAASAANAADFRGGESVEVTGAHDQILFAAGEDVRVAATSTDDVVVSGGDIRIDGAALDDLIVAGGEISFGNATARDIFAAGGEIDIIAGRVADDLIAAGGRITLGPEARVDGDAIITGGRLRIESPIGGGLRASGGDIFLNGAVTGDVHLDGGRIRLGPDAHILGSLTHRGRNVTIAPEARVEGQTTALRPRQHDFRPLAGLAIWAAAAVLFGLFVMAVVIAIVFPRLMNESAASIRERPLIMLALGVAIAVLGPMLVVLLAVTLLGLPLAFVVGVALVLLWPLALVGAAYAGAMWTRARTRRATEAPSAGGRALWAGLAMIVLIIVGLIPVLGFLVWIVAYLFGLGAVASQGWRALAKPAAAAA